MASGFLQPAGKSSFPSVNSPERQGNDSTKGALELARNKVVLSPGHSLMDWIRYGHREPDLAGTGGQVLTVTEEELANHNTEKDAWIVLRGKVYNLTPYMDFHPGGIPEIMRGAGVDSTQLFDEIHKWVNAESMLSKCFVGNLQTAAPSRRRGSTSSRKSNSSLTVNGPAAVPNLNGLKPPSGPVPPKYDWYQSKMEVTIVIYTKWADMRCENVIIDKPNTAREMLITVLLQEHSYLIHIELEECIAEEYKVQLSKKENGKIEITLQKILEKQWTSLGRLLEKHGIFNRTMDTAVIYRTCTVDSIYPVTHDCKLFCIRLPSGSRICIPLGYHVHIKHDIEGMEVTRSYTAVSRAMYLNRLDKPMWNGQAFYLMIKIYADGALTPWIGSLTAGDSISVSSPVGTFDETCLMTCTHLMLLAAGTGFTPMVRLLQVSLQDANHAPICRSVKLMCFNKTQSDILWKEQLDTLIEDSFCLEVEHILSGTDDSWTGKRGRIRAELLHDWLPARSDDVTPLVCICGPTAFTKEAIRLVEEQGFSPETIHAFQA